MLEEVWRRTFVTATAPRTL